MATTTIESGVEPPSRATGTQSSSKHRKSDFEAEDTLERKLEAEHNRFYDEVLACIGDAEGVLLLGPSSAKGELRKRIKNKALLSRVAELETADKMTDRQIVAKVRAHFAEAPAKKSAARKKVSVAKKPVPTKKAANARKVADAKRAGARKKTAKASVRRARESS